MKCQYIILSLTLSSQGWISAALGRPGVAENAGISHIELSNPVMEQHKELVARWTAASQSPSNLTVGLTKRDISSLSLYGSMLSTLFAYHGNVSFGTPAQSFRYLFDTGSFQLWVRSAQCKSSLCANKPSFSGTKSSTYQSMNQKANPISYVDGTKINGVLASDVVSTSGLSVDGMTFMEATEFSAGSDDTDGIMGLSFVPSGHPNSFFGTLVQQQMISSGGFSYFIDETDAGGGITFGGYDQNRITEPLQFVSVTQYLGKQFIYWQTSVTEISTTSGSIPLTSPVEAVMDTGTSLVIMDEVMAQAINSLLGLTRLQQDTTSGAKLYGMACPNGIPTNLPPISITLTTIRLTMVSTDYLFIKPGSDGNMMCLSAFAGIASAATSSNSTKSIIIGNVILRKFYTVFDYANRRIGFSTAKRSKSIASNFAPIPESPSGMGNVNSGAFSTVISPGIQLLSLAVSVMYLFIS